MPIDLSRLEDRRQRLADERRIEATAQARMVAAAGDRAETLRLSEEWRVWEEHVRVLLAEDERQQAAARAALDRPEIVGDDLLRLRNQFFTLCGRVAARTEDLALPAELSHRGAEATKNLLTSGEIGG